MFELLRADARAPELLQPRQSASELCRFEPESPLLLPVCACTEPCQGALEFSSGSPPFLAMPMQDPLHGSQNPVGF